MNVNILQKVIPSGAECACNETMGLIVLFDLHHSSLCTPSFLNEGHAHGVPRPLGFAPKRL